MQAGVARLAGHSAVTPGRSSNRPPKTSGARKQIEDGLLAACLYRRPLAGLDRVGHAWVTARAPENSFIFAARLSVMKIFMAEQSGVPELLRHTT